MPIVYETHYNSEDPQDYPKMYKIFKEGDQEVGRVFAEFSDAPEGSISTYIAAFKDYMANLISSIPEVELADKEVENKIKLLISTTSYLRGAMPVEDTRPVAPEPGLD